MRYQLYMDSFYKCLKEAKRLTENLGASKSNLGSVSIYGFTITRYHYTLGGLATLKITGACSSKGC